jgi:hypothetical protein
MIRISLEFEDGVFGCRGGLRPPNPALTQRRYGSTKNGGHSRTAVIDRRYR